MKRSKIFPLVVLVPILLLVCVFVLYPLGYSIYSSFFLWRPESPSQSIFIGMGNYIKLFTDDPRFMISLKNTAIYVSIKTIIVVFVGIGIALILNKVHRLQKVYIFFIFLPFLCLPAAIGVLFKYFYQPTFGIINQLLNSVGLPSQSFLSSSTQALYSVIAVDIWQTLGFSTLIFFTGLINMSKVYVEAAEIDGAGPVRVFFNITFPLLRHTFIFISIYTMILAFQAFDFVYVMTSTGGGAGGSAGGPGNSTFVLSFLIYNEGMLRVQLDRAGAVGFILFIIILTLTILQYWVLKPKWEY